MTQGPATDAGAEVLLIALSVVLVVGPLLKRLCRGLGVPVTTGYIALGLILGGILESVGRAPGFTFEATFSVLAQLGVVALLFRVGLKSHTSVLLKKLPDASLIWVCDVAGTLAVGFVVARYGLHWTLETSLVVAVAFSATSIAVALAVWDELGLAGTGAAGTLLDVAELDDLSAGVLLAVLLGTLPALLQDVDGVWQQAGSAFVIILAKLAAFVCGCYLFAHFVEARFTHTNRRLSDTRASLTISILGAGLGIAALADQLGFSVAIGALLAGLAFSRDPEAVQTDGSFAYFYEFLTPFFFVHIGMQTSPGAIADSAGVALLLFLAAAASKLVFTGFPALLSLDRADALRLGVSMIPRAEIALVVVYECRAIDERLVPENVFAAMVIVALTTSIVAPIILRPLLQTKIRTADAEQ
jgi:Kef-type K+ transport system membrane component KefB